MYPESIKISSVINTETWMWWYTLAVSTTWEVEVGVPLKSRSLRPAWATQQNCLKIKIPKQNYKQKRADPIKIEQRLSIFFEDKRY